MQHYGLDRLASENNAVAVYLYVPKAVVKRKGFNLEWCDSSADGVVESQQQLEESDLLVKEAIAMVSENSKTFLCCINVPDVEKAVEKMSGEYAKSINQIVEGHGFTGKVVKWKSQGGPNSSSTSFVALLLTR